jgi:hypothetical protein
MIQGTEERVYFNLRVWIGVYRAAEVTAKRGEAQKLQTGDMWWRNQVVKFGASGPEEEVAEEISAVQD